MTHARELFSVTPSSSSASAAAFSTQYPRAHLYVMEMLRFMSDINQPCLSTPFFWYIYFFLILFRCHVYFCLYGPFNCISFHKFSRPLSAFSLSCCGFISALLVLSIIFLFMKVSFSPDIILSDWLGSKHQLSNWLFFSATSDFHIVTPHFPLQFVWSWHQKQQS